jgi:hypothetical protein
MLFGDVEFVAYLSCWHDMGEECHVCVLFGFSHHDSCTSVGVKSSTVVVRESKEDTDMALFAHVMPTGQISNKLNITKQHAHLLCTTPELRALATMVRTSRFPSAIHWPMSGSVFLKLDKQPRLNLHPRSINIPNIKLGTPRVTSRNVRR